VPGRAGGICLVVSGWVQGQVHDGVRYSWHCAHPRETVQKRFCRAAPAPHRGRANDEAARQMDGGEHDDCALRVRARANRLLAGEELLSA
jgi:hypothetical protein